MWRNCFRGVTLCYTNVNWNKWIDSSGSSVITFPPSLTRPQKYSKTVPNEMSTQDSDLVTRVNAIVNDSISKSIPMSTSLLEAGVDSLSAVEIRRNLEESMGTDLPATVVFDYPTIVDIARYIGSLIKSPISKVSHVELKKEERESSVVIDSYSMKMPHCCASLSALFDALLSKRDTVQVTPSSRWDVLTYSSLHSNGMVTVPFASFLHDIYSWDCAKYSVGAREALHLSLIHI